MHRFRQTTLPFSSDSNSIKAITKNQLGYWTCFFIDVPENLHRERIQSSEENNTLYSCFFKTRYLTGENVGPTICVILCVLIAIIGVFGVATNIVNVLVLRHSTKGSSLQKLLIILAGFDLLACLFALMTSVGLQVILDNVNRSKAMLIFFKIVFLLYSLGRTGSVFITILVTVERYFVVVHHFQAKAWLNTRRPIIVTVLWILMILLINLPWWINSVVYSQNAKPFAKGPLSQYPAIFVSTRFGTELYYPTWLRPIHVFIDFVLPFPVLLLFNGLLYRFIYNWNKSRASKTLSGSHVREVNAAKMFSIVAIGLFSCHTFAVIDYIVTEVTGKVYREFLLSIMLAVTLNAAINFFVYYVFGQDFREYFWLLVGSKMDLEMNTNANRKSSAAAGPFGRTRSMFGKVSFGGGDVILHESVRYTKTFERETDGEKNEESRLLEETKN